MEDKTMRRRYYFDLLDENYNDLNIAISDSWSKNTAIRQARGKMAERGIRKAKLSVNSLRTNDILDVIDIDLDEE